MLDIESSIWRCTFLIIHEKAYLVIGVILPSREVKGSQVSDSLKKILNESVFASIKVIHYRTELPTVK